MTQKLAAISWLLLFLLSVQCFAGHEAWALSESYKRSFQRQLHFIISKHPKYTWGGAEDIEKGLDCSGYIFLAAKWAAIPGITRTTANRMALGMGGWVGREIGLNDADKCDLAFWTFTMGRPHGHTGVFLGDKEGRQEVTHASAHSGVVVERLYGPLLRNLTRVRRLTIGD